MIRVTPNLRCAECRFEAPAVSFNMLGNTCPHCGSVNQLDPDNDLIIVGHARTETEQGGVWIRINWQELRMLSVWARFWADERAQADPQQSKWMLRVVDAITHQIKKAAPTWALTVADDAVIAQRQNPNAEIVARRPDGSEVQLEPTWLNSETTRIEPPPPKEK